MVCEDYLTNSSTDIISLSNPLLENLLSKSAQISELSAHCYPSIFGFLAILNALSRTILHEAILWGKSLKFP